MVEQGIVQINQEKGQNRFLEVGKKVLLYAALPAVLLALHHKVLAAAVLAGEIGYLWGKRRHG